MSAKKPHVLVVEDDPDNFEWVRRSLSRYGYDIEWAGTVVDGLEKLNVLPCALILDLALPDGSGANTLRTVRDHDLPIKVAVVSGAAGSALHAEAVRLKPDAFLLKPVDPIELISWLKSVFP